MRLCFNIELPDEDLRVGGPWLRDMNPRHLVDEGFFAPLDMRGRSRLGFGGRQYRRFFPVIQALESLTQTDEWQLARAVMEGRPLSRLYDSGVRYETEKAEEWLDSVTLRKRRRADCEDLAGDRTAELRFYDHIPAVPCIKWREFATPKGRITLIHCQVLHPDDTIEDPSALLGMEGEYQ